jgi:hypothetical protein
MSEFAMDEELRAWFEGEGLLRYAVTADESGEVSETWRGPLVALGARDEDFVQAPKPDDTGYGKALREMVMEDYNNFMYRWLEAAAHASDLRCANCGRVICDADDLPDPETWDAIFVEKELVAWMAVHFDCKKWLAKKLKGMHPFELEPQPPPRYDLGGADVPIRRPAEDAGGESLNGHHD